MGTKRRATPEEEIPAGMRRAAKVLRSFFHDGEMFTVATPTEVVNDKVPADVLQQHVDTGFAEWVFVDDTKKPTE